MTSIAITVCTRQRPRMLRQCLASALAELQGRNSDDFVVVVENDAATNSVGVVEEIRSSFPQSRLFYELEPEPGIPFARNRTVDIARREGADWVAFIDDDEQLVPGWLDAMHQAIETLGAEALTGPVERVPAVEVPAWMVTREGKPRQHGQIVDLAATNNTLVDLNWLDGHLPELRFDERLRYTGGSDSEFFDRFVRGGGTIRWVGDALVREEVPASRLTLTWQVARKARTQANNVRRYRRRNGYAAALVRYVPAAARRILFRGALSCLAAGPVALVSQAHGQRLWFTGRRAIGSGIGALNGLIGRDMTPYRVVEGD
jgi:succinoglycan biosynthesis protein ExoM